MVNTYVKNKIPWLKILLVLMLVIFVVVVVGLVAKDVGAAMVNGFIGFWVGTYRFFFVTPSWISTVVAAAGVGGIVILIAYRKYFFRQKVLGGTIGTVTPSYQSSLINTQPVQPIPVPQQIIGQPVVDPTKTEVTTS